MVSDIVPPGLYVPRTPMLLGQVVVLARVQAPESKGQRQAVLAAANQDDERFGDFEQHKVTMKISCSDQCQQQLSIISGNHGGVGMLVVQRRRLKARDKECSATIGYYPRNEGLDDLC
ncbi:hypothetical protein PENANT_c013G11039 [Penicillium antarcticum]|uniref:Uncharacterized protein n=1 Tax=Penicillium antarcticum TaxID=416450 RepID=A0A1V6Q5W4_9EURO|nr:hypothetical protein PENANT_c013G11039 [Penicillium antarcticum]